MTVIVSDTSPIRSLAFLGRLDLLRFIYGQIIVPPAVAGELAFGHSRPEVTIVDFEFLTVRAPASAQRVMELRGQVDLGEAEAIALAEEHADCLILIDERRGRRLAKSLGLDVVGTVGIVLEAKQRGLIPEAGPLLKRLRDENDFYLSDSLIRSALATVGEDPDAES